MLVCRALSLFITACYTVRLSASIQWPAGSYGIPKATSGCPQSVGFQWDSGRRFQDTDNMSPDNNKSSPFHLDGNVDNTGVNRSFCIKTDTRNDTNRSYWPTGKYCVYKKGKCPVEMSSGFVYWDDDYFSNKSTTSGTLPDGKFDDNTKIDFCCKTDGNKKDPVPLPASTPFFLLAYESAECQQVKWALATVEWILYDNVDLFNDDDEGGSYPYGAGIKKAYHKIHYCYYHGCNQTLDNASDTFHSPNYPQKYPNGQYCSWRITVKPTQRVHLTFTKFTLQTGNNTDSVHVYNGENESGEGLGVFYGGHPPPREGLYSSSNHMFVIFKSDSNGSFTGFNASYLAVNHSASIQWPAGSYGIPKATSGCPYSVGFQWESGWRYQDTDDDYSYNDKSSPFHLDGNVDTDGVRRSFCIKTDTRNDTNRSSWPPGKYCVYKKGACPTGMTSGYVEWDDDDNGNLNSEGGTLPDGVFNVNTKIDFCCRTDGYKNYPVSLPVSTPFFLLAYESAECQQVKWALATVEWILYDNEDYANKDKEGGSYPYGAGIKKAYHKIHYCYYHGCNKTLSKSSGTFQSPNYPQKYPDGQYCSWRITVKPTHRVHLTFTNFTLQTGNNTDSVHVYNGENESGEGLGVFYGGHPPPREGLYSSSNQVFVIFKSDSSGSFTGFNASYLAVNHSDPTTVSAPTSSSTPEMTSSYMETNTNGISTSMPDKTQSGDGRGKEDN